MNKKHGFSVSGVCGASSHAKTRGVLAGSAALLLAAVFTLTGCASVPATSGFMDGKKPITIISTVNTDSQKTGILTETVYLGYFGKSSYPSIADTAKQGGITKIATVEYYLRPGILGIWTEYTTIVTGE